MIRAIKRRHLFQTLLIVLPPLFKQRPAWTLPFMQRLSAFLKLYSVVIGDTEQLILGLILHEVLPVVWILHLPGLHPVLVDVPHAGGGGGGGQVGRALADVISGQDAA